MNTDREASNLDVLAEKIIRKAKSFLITNIGRIPDEAVDEEFYLALSYAFREETMINWLATARTFQKFDSRMLYYMSMEYMPGRIFTNNMTNLGKTDLIKLICQKCNRNFKEIINQENDPGLGNGGLGRLASCLLDSMATLHYPVQAYGLRYQYGIFEQQLWNGVQIEAPDCWLLNENPWEFRRDQRRLVVKFCGTPESSYNIHGDEILELKNYEEVGVLPYDLPITGYAKDPNFTVLKLRLWSAKDSPRNFQLQRYNAGRLDQAAENMTLTDVLYPSENTEIGKRIRLKQEFLLVSASLQDIIRHYLSTHQNFRLFADKVRIQINDTHASLIIPELIRILTKEHDLPWKTALDITQACTGFTNHTILSEALEQWDFRLMSFLLPRQYKVIERLNQDFCSAVRAKYPHDEERVRRMSILQDEKVRMAHLAIIGSHKVNGVAELHTKILKERVFKDFFEMYPEKFVNITNGVTQRRWLLECNPELAQFVTDRIGDGWIIDFKQIYQLAKYASDSTVQNEFLAVKRKKKIQLIEFLNKENRLRDSSGEFFAPAPLVDPDSLFEVQTKRIHEYKRQLMNALHLIMVYFDIIRNPQHGRVKRTVIIGGKAAGGYETAKDIIRLIYCIARKINRDPSVGGILKVIYLENYNVSRAEIVIPAADLSVQISTAGTEASGTGNMKFTMNGALTIGTKDGANIEMEEEITSQWWPFSFGCTADQIEKMKKDHSYNPREIYEKNSQIKQALDTLHDHTFAQNEEEHQVFCRLFDNLLKADSFFVLRDLESYYQTQLKAEALYKEPSEWAKFALNNIAGLGRHGKFSTDNSVVNYVEKVWNITPCPVDREILDRVRYQFSIEL